MAKTTYISDRPLYFDNRDGDHGIDRIVDDATGIPAAKYVNAGKPITREVFEKFGMTQADEDKNASADADVEDKSVVTTNPEGRRTARRRVVGSANAPEVQAEIAERNETPVTEPESSSASGTPETNGEAAPASDTTTDTPAADAPPATCEATTHGGNVCGNKMPCRYKSHVPEVAAE
jgi:hypothetical protein